MREKEAVGFKSILVFQGGGCFGGIFLFVCFLLLFFLFCFVFLLFFFFFFVFFFLQKRSLISPIISETIIAR